MKMKQEDLIQKVSRIGNISGGAPSQRIINFHDWISLPHPDRMLLEETDPSLILKFYVMHEKGNDISEGDIREAADFLQYKYNTETDLAGLGFAVMSSEMLNICRWHNQNTDVIVPAVYLLDKGVYEWQKADVNKVGAFCSGEKRVYDHENNAWLKYLNSEKTQADKLNYLIDTLPDRTIVRS